MAIVYQGDAGLNQGITQAAGVLAQAIGQMQQGRKRAAQRKNIGNELSRGPLDLTTLGRILQLDGGLEALQALSPIISPILKEKEKSQGSQNWLEQKFPNIFSSNQNGVSTLDESNSRNSNVPSISGVPNRPPQEDSNRFGPREQEMYQQGGHQGMGLEPTQEANKASLINQPDSLGLSNWSNDDIVALASSPYQAHANMAKAEFERRKLEQKGIEKKEERAFQRNKPIFERVQKLRDTSFSKELALTRLEDALSSGDINRFMDWAIQALGLPATSTSAQILDSAVKELFVDQLQGATGIRFNQFLERILKDASPQVGKSPAANQEFLEAMYILNDVGNFYVKSFDELESQYEKMGLELPKNTDKLLTDKLRNYEQKKLTEYRNIKEDIKKGKVISNSGIRMRSAKRMTDQYPPSPGTVWVLPPKGDPVEVPLKDLQAAISKGGGKLVE